MSHNCAKMLALSLATRLTIVNLTIGLEKEPNDAEIAASLNVVGMDRRLATLVSSNSDFEVHEACWRQRRQTLCRFPATPPSRVLASSFAALATIGMEITLIKKKICLVLLAMIVTGCEPLVVEEVPVAETSAASVGTEANADEESGVTAQSSGVSVADDAFDDVPQAVAVLTSAKEQTNVVQALVWLSMQGKPAVEPLSAVLQDDSAELSAKVYACRALGQIGSPASEALVDALSSETGAVRINAAKQLGRIKPSNQAIIAALVKLVDHLDTQSRQHALKALTEIGPAAKDLATDRLIAVLNDTNENDIVRNEAKRALKSVAPRQTFND